MLRLAGAGPADTVMDLGSGDGRIVIAAAKNFGARGIGIEIDAKLVDVSRANARRAGVAERTHFEEQDALRADLSRASVVTVYLLPFLIDQLQPRFLDELKPGARVVTHAFGMKGWRPDRSETVRLSRRHDSQGDTSEIHLWIVPARARGDWQAPGWRLSIVQNFQQIEVEGEASGRPLAVNQASLQGTAIAFSGEDFQFSGRIAGERISGQLVRAGSASPLVFTRR
ncbi:MAG: cyclopropane-fatty-acyl-phospholipid synthase family protein [Burkholderiales bacterium]